MEELNLCVEAIEKSDPAVAIPFVVVQVLVIAFAFAKKSLPQFVKELPEFIARIIENLKSKK